MILFGAAAAGQPEPPRAEGRVRAGGSLHLGSWQGGSLCTDKGGRKEGGGARGVSLSRAGPLAAVIAKQAALIAPLCSRGRREELS